VWDGGVFVVYATKTGKQRIIPMATRLRKALADLFGWLGARYPDQHIRWVLPWLRRCASSRERLLRNANLRTQATRIIARAEVQRWPHIFQNLRTSCAIDLARSRPQHVATEWLGHTADVALEFYLRATKDDHARGVEDAFGPCWANTGCAATGTAIHAHHNCADIGATP
jgi:integrase